MSRAALLFSFLLLLSSSPVVLVVATKRYTKCNKWYSSPCLGNNDRRYDSNFTLRLTDLSPIWNRLEGYWITDFVQVLNGTTGESIQPSLISKEQQRQPTLVPNPYVLKRAFYNESFQESRYSSNRYFVFGAATDEAFCNQTLQDDHFNTIGDGVCGVNGWSSAAGYFGVTTYEKDGRIDGLSQMGLYQHRLVTDLVSKATLNKYTFNFTPMGDINTAYSYTEQDEHLVSSLMSIFSKNDTEISTTQSTIMTFPTDNADETMIGTPTPAPIVYVLVSRSIKVTELEWLAAIQRSYLEFSVLPSDRVPLPMSTYCLVPDDCPVEYQWCQKDPACSSSPYQEPDATIRAGPIVGWVMLGVFLLLVWLYVWHRRRMKCIKRRLRAAFATRIAETIRLQFLSSDQSQHEFAEKLLIVHTNSSNGRVTKEELQEFLSSDFVLSESDLNCMFAAVDMDQTGTVDFVEFCVFLGLCHEDFQSTKSRQSAVASFPVTKNEKSRGWRRLFRRKTASNQVEELATPVDQATVDVGAEST